MNGYTLLDIKLFLFGNGIFNLILSGMYNDCAVGIFKNKRSEIAVFVFGMIYFVMGFYDEWFYSQKIWKIIISANLVGAVFNLSLHRQIDDFWWLNLNDPNKAMIYLLIYNQFIVK